MTAVSVGERSRKLSISDDIKLVIGKWLEEETVLIAVASEELESSGVVFRFGPEHAGSLVIIEMRRPG
jgi:hypothetical protein